MGIAFEDRGNESATNIQPTHENPLKTAKTYATQMSSTLNPQTWGQVLKGSRKCLATNGKRKKKKRKKTKKKKVSVHVHTSGLVLSAGCERNASGTMTISASVGDFPDCTSNSTTESRLAESDFPLSTRASNVSSSNVDCGTDIRNHRKSYHGPKDP